MRQCNLTSLSKLKIIRLVNNSLIPNYTFWSMNFARDVIASSFHKNFQHLLSHKTRNIKIQKYNMDLIKLESSNVWNSMDQSLCGQWVNEPEWAMSQTWPSYNGARHKVHDFLFNYQLLIVNGKGINEEHHWLIIIDYLSMNNWTIT